MEEMQQLLARGALAEADRDSAQHSVLMAPEAENLVKSLKTFSPRDVGSRLWFQQQAHTEKLNLQSHANAKAHAADFVQEYIISHDKVTTLVHELLVMEVWKENLFPLLGQHLAQHVDSVSAYMLLYYEASLSNLLEMIFFEDEAFEALAEDYSVELVDWCARQLNYLHGAAHEDAKPLHLSCKELVDRSELDLLHDRVKELRIGVAMCSVTILRYMTGAVACLNISAVTRLVQHHDTIGMLIPLLERPPWIRDRSGTTERREGTQWIAVAPQDRFQLSSIDAQVWLALTNLVVDPKFRAKYQLNSLRKDALSRVRRYLNDLIIDQLPVLKDLQRVVDEIALNYCPNFDSYESGALVIEQVRGTVIFSNLLCRWKSPQARMYQTTKLYFGRITNYDVGLSVLVSSMQIPEIRANLLRQDWESLAMEAKSGHLSQKALASASKDRISSMLAALDFLADWDSNGASSNPASAVSMKDQLVKVSVYEKTSTGVMASWSSLDLSVDTSKEPIPITIKGESGTTVLGERWTLKSLPGEAKVLPTNGRIAVCFQSSTAQALLQLPCSTSKEINEMSALPQGVWVTVGLLAQDKFVLQLRLKRMPGSEVRNKEEGIWHVYRPVGGALTTLTEVKAGKENAKPARVIVELD